MKLSKERIVLFLILFLAVILRVIGLNKIPPELFGDEVDVGYQSYSLLKTGRDYRGNFLPFYAESFAEPRAPLLFYATVPFVAILGLNEFGVRLAPAFFGVLDIFILYLLVKEISKNEKLALISSFLLTITPWHLHYSRAAFEVTLLLFLILLGTLSFLKALKGKTKWWIPMVLSFGLSFYTYNTANIFVPLWGLLLLFLHRREIKNLWPNSSKVIKTSFVVGLLIVLPIIKNIFFGSAGFRFKLVSIFSDPLTVDLISSKRSVASLSSITERLFHNKAVYWTRAFWGNYLETISLKFIFISGDANPRHSLPGNGLFFLSFLPLYLIGFHKLLKEKNTESFLIFGWLLLAPIPSSLTYGGGSHATRLFLMLPPLIFLTATGVIVLFKQKLGKLVLSALVLILIFEFSLYVHEMTTHYTREHFRHWHYGYKEVLQFYLKNKDRCEYIYFNNSHEPFLIRYLFWSGIDPAWFQKNFTGDRENSLVENVFQGFNLGKAFFGRLVFKYKLNAIKSLLSKGNTCYVAFQGDEIDGDWNLTKNPEEGIEVLGLVKNPLGDPYIYLLTKEK